jgi:hypothetical protein
MEGPLSLIQGDEIWRHFDLHEHKKDPGFMMRKERAHQRFKPKCTYENERTKEPCYH